MNTPLERWHACVKSRSTQALSDILADEVVFHSPVVHTPQRGKAITQLYLAGALKVLNTEHFRYTREISSGTDALLEFETEIDGLYVNGVDLIRFDAEGRIVDFKVMLRPLKAVNMVHQQMASMLAAMGKPRA